MYDTRVYKERRKARFEADPEYKLQEQQRHRERYQRKKLERLQQSSADVTTVPKDESTAPMEIMLDIKPSASTSRHQQSTTTSQQAQTSSLEFNHLSQMIEEEDEEIPYSSQDTHNNISATEDHQHQYNTYQTVSIKLPHNMAVLLVPVNMTCVTDDDAMQLQQIGKRVAIVRGSMTNVAEFQVLPAMTFDAQSKILGMETDIRQIVINEGGGGEEARGPTIQITPQVMESADQETIIDEEVMNLPQETLPTIVHEEVEEKEVVHLTVPDPPPKPKPYAYIEAIRCGRCLQAFEDLLELSGHQKRDHENMMVIEVGNTHTGEKPKDCLRPDLYEQELAMDDKILARLAKNEEAKLRKLMQANVRGSGSGSNVGNNINKGSKVGSKGGGGRGTMSKTGGGGVISGAVGRAKNTTRGAFVRGNFKALKCHVCLQSFTDTRVYNAHLQSHHSAVAVQDGQEFNSSFNEYVAEEEEEDEVVELVEADTERKGGRKYSIVSTPYKTGQPVTEHIITDGAGNHIVVHADTPDQLQELIVSLESGTLQMVNGGSQGDGSTATGVYVLEDTEEKG